MTKFPKGSKVWLLRSYDNKGTIWARECVVDSWGAKQIHLRSIESGKTLQHRFYTRNVNSNDGGDFSFTTILPHNADVQAAGLKMAESFLVWERARLQNSLVSVNANPPGATAAWRAGYARTINTILAALHEPRVQIVG